MLPGVARSERPRMAQARQTIDHPETGGRVKWHLTAADTGGRLLRAEWWTPPGAGMRGERLHRSAEERIEILAGRMKAELDGRLVELGPGEHLAVPAGVRHRWWNSGDEELHFVSERADIDNHGRNP
jgi:mannose-6-phosphate isomerase-like protein (cupin superfamily)